MLKPRLVQVGTLAVLAAAMTAPRGALLAQGAQSVQGGQATVQLAFGYECDDRFLVRNDGAQSVTVEYGVPGAQQRSSLDLKGNESVELASTTNEPLELWVAGKLVATERKGNRPCAAAAADAQVQPGDQYAQNAEVVVVPIEPYGGVAYAGAVGYVEPAYYPAPLIYVRPAFGYGYGYRGPSVSVVRSLSRGGGFAARPRVVSGGGFRGVTGGVRPGAHFAEAGRLGRPNGGPGSAQHFSAPARQAAHAGGSSHASHGGGGSSHATHGGGSSRGAHAGNRVHH